MRCRALSIVELLVVVSIIGLLYAATNRDVFVPSRMPKVDDCNWFADIAGGRKYRPTFLAMMSSNTGVPAFEDPKACKTDVDRFGEPGDRQNYTSPVFVCPSVRRWTDERNGSYGYNYQFLGNSRLRDRADIHSFKNWPVVTTSVRAPSATVAVADCMGTAASFPPRERAPYAGNSRDGFRMGNEGFNLDPPRIDPMDGEMADRDDGLRTAADPRHADRASVLWVDTHVDAQPLAALGYEFESDGSVGMSGSNKLWTPTRQDYAWTSEQE